MRHSSTTTAVGPSSHGFRKLLNAITDRSINRTGLAVLVAGLVIYCVLVMCGWPGQMHWPRPWMFGIVSLIFATGLLPGVANILANVITRLLWNVPRSDRGNQGGQSPSASSLAGVPQGPKKPAPLVAHEVAAETENR